MSLVTSLALSSKGVILQVCACMVGLLLYEGEVDYYTNMSSRCPATVSACEGIRPTVIIAHPNEQADLAPSIQQDCFRLTSNLSNHLKSSNPCMRHVVSKLVNDVVSL